SGVGAVVHNASAPDPREMALTERLRKLNDAGHIVEALRQKVPSARASSDILPQLRTLRARLLEAHADEWIESLEVRFREGVVQSRLLESPRERWSAVKKIQELLYETARGVQKGVLDVTATRLEWTRDKLESLSDRLGSSDAETGDTELRAVFSEAATLVGRS